MTYPMLSTLVIFFALVVAAVAEPVDAPDSDTVLARVGDTAITLGHAISYMRWHGANLAQLPDEKLLDLVIENMVIQETLLQGARASGQPLPKPVDLAVENARRMALGAFRVKQAYNAMPTERALQARFDRLYREFNASHILVSTEQEARRVIDAFHGGSPFEALARRHHATGPDSYLQWFKLDKMVPEFSAAVRELSIGQVSDPVQTQYGWHVIRLNAVRSIEGKEGKTLEDPDVRAFLVRKFREETLKRQVDELKKRFGVTRYNDDIDPSLIRRTDLIAD